MPKISNDWLNLIGGEFEKPYYLDLRKFLKKEYGTRVICPPADDIFNAFHLTPVSELKCLILGQDPYIGENQAHGLAFSVKSGLRLPPSLINIFKEIEANFGIKPPLDGDLSYLAKQGVMLLNTTLTVRLGVSMSHAGKGWETFTDAVMKEINNLDKPLVIMLWGNHARTKKGLFTNQNHLVLETSHPSPLSASRGFLGSMHFIKANEFLEKKGIPPVNWIKNQI